MDHKTCFGIVNFFLEYFFIACIFFLLEHARFLLRTCENSKSANLNGLTNNYIESSLLLYIVWEQLVWLHIDYLSWMDEKFFRPIRVKKIVSSFNSLIIFYTIFFLSRFNQRVSKNFLVTWFTSKFISGGLDWNQILYLFVAFRPFGRLFPLCHLQILLPVLGFFSSMKRLVMGLSNSATNQPPQIPLKTVSLSSPFFFPMSFITKTTLLIHSPKNLTSHPNWVFFFFVQIFHPTPNCCVKDPNDDEFWSGFCVVLQLQVRVVIKGRVQGVFYRNWTVENARELGIKGWVRNRRDGSVEALLSGDPNAVQEMEGRCRRGPPSAMVTALDVVPSDENPGDGFDRRPTVWGSEGIAIAVHGHSSPLNLAVFGVHELVSFFCVILHLMMILFVWSINVYVC